MDKILRQFLFFWENEFLVGILCLVLLYLVIVFSGCIKEKHQ